MEPTVNLRVRQEDKALVESLITRVQQDYKGKIKKDVTLKIDTENYLSSETCGGIELIAAKGRIKVCSFRFTKSELVLFCIGMKFKQFFFGGLVFFT